jgi:hypothetical protein
MLVKFVSSGKWHCVFGRVVQDVSEESSGFISKSKAVELSVDVEEYAFIRRVFIVEKIAN